MARLRLTGPQITAAAVACVLIAIGILFRAGCAGHGASGGTRVEYADTLPPVWDSVARDTAEVTRGAGVRSVRKPRERKSVARDTIIPVARHHLDEPVSL